MKSFNPLRNSDLVSKYLGGVGRKSVVLGGSLAVLILFSWLFLFNETSKTGGDSQDSSFNILKDELASGFRCTAEQKKNQIDVVNILIPKWDKDRLALGCGVLYDLQPFLMSHWDPSKEKIFLVNVGANKGYNILEWMQMWAPLTEKGPKAWGKVLKEKYPDIFSKAAMCGTCGDCKLDPDEFGKPWRPNLVLPKEGVEDAGVYLFGLEPSIVNFELLQDLEAWMDFKNFQLIHAAASDQPGMGKFPRTSLGFTRAGLSNKGVDVNITTIDMLMSSHGIDHINYLKIDAEGHDAKVIRGAKVAFQNQQVSLLEFEYHYFAEWKKIALGSVVAELDEFGYDCFLATGRRKGDELILLTGCWDEAFEFKRWSNVLCSSRKEVRLTSFLKSHCVWL